MFSEHFMNMNLGIWTKYSNAHEFRYMNSVFNEHFITISLGLWTKHDLVFNMNRNSISHVYNLNESDLVRY